MHTTPQTLWIVTEGIAGTENQCIGIAESLKSRFWPSLDIVIKRVNLKFPYSLWSPFWRVGEGPGMLTPGSDPVSAPFPDIVIAGGRKAIGITRYIRKASLGRTFVCIVQHPRVRFDDFDLVAVPKHDLKKECRPGEGRDLETARDCNLRRNDTYSPEVPACAGTTILTNGAPNRITLAWLNAARDKWRDIIPPLPGPRTAVLIGGNSKHHRLSAATMDRLIAHLHDLHAKRGGSLMITVSRRTPEDLRAKLEQAFAAGVPSPLVGEGGAQGEALGGRGGNKLNAPSPASTYVEAPSPTRGEGLTSIFIYTGTGDNPYAGFLAYADYIVVTTDSTSMISDAASTGKPIEFFPLPGGSKRNDAFLAHCRNLGVGVPNTTYTPWNDADRVADQIQKMIQKKNN